MSQPGPYKLSPPQVEQIEAALAQAGRFGRVRLVVQGGRLAQIAVTESVDVVPPAEWHVRRDGRQRGGLAG